MLQLFIILSAILSIFLLVWSYQSDTSIDKLQHLLAQKKYKEANIHTMRLVHFTIQRTVKGRISIPRTWNLRLISISRLLKNLTLGMVSIYSIINRYSTIPPVTHSREQDLLHQFPCSVLREIDRAWSESTDGHFGISVQMKIYEDIVKRQVPLNQWELYLGDRLISYFPVLATAPSPGTCPLETQPVIQALAEALSWQEENSRHFHKYTFISLEALNYSLNAPQGHLPCLVYYDERIDKRGIFAKEKYKSDSDSYLMISIMLILWARLRSCSD